MKLGAASEPFLMFNPPSAVLLENKMLAKGKEQRVFGNSSLRDKWEKKAQNMADQCKQEAEWKEKSDQKL